jgi:hypothetical protein
LLLAISFTIVVNLVVVARFIWPELLGTTLPVAIWLLVGVVWCCSTYRAIRLQREWLAAAEEANVDLFVQAQQEYLRGHWFEAETLLRRRLELDPADAETRLLLATMLRHGKRPDEAKRELRRLRRLESADGWRWEAEREEELLKQQFFDASPTSQGDSSNPTTAAA